jgi:hypothetical protein
MIMCKFLQTMLPTTFDQWYNSSMNIPTENYHRYILTTLRTILQWDEKKIIWWSDIYTDRITDVVIIEIILSVNPSRIFNLWPNAQPSSPPLLLLCKTFLCNKITIPQSQSQSQHNSTSHKFSSHHNTQFVSIRVLIQISLRILHLKKANLSFFF